MALSNIPMYRCRVKTEATFTANDPWNQNRATTFTLEDYVRSEHRQVSPDYTAPGMDFERALKSGIDGVERILPDSLAELWRGKRIPDVLLPGLLKELEPTLTSSDYPVLIKNKVRTFLYGTLGLLYALTLLLVVWSLVDGSMAVWQASIFLLVMTLFCGGLIYFVNRRVRRRKDLTKWLLARITAEHGG